MKESVYTCKDMLALYAVSSHEYTQQSHEPNQACDIHYY